MPVEMKQNTSVAKLRAKKLPLTGTPNTVTANRAMQKKLSIASPT